jgi:hypothetical protein
MEWLGDLIGLGANVASGGLFGLLGSLIGVGAKWLQAKQAAKAKAEEWKHEITLRQLAMEANDRETENELAIARSEGSWKGLSDSYHTVIPSTAVPSWTNAIRSLFRPFLTISLWVLVVIELRWMLDGTLEIWIENSGQFGVTIKYVIDSTVFSAATATTWWFGDRAMTPPGQKAR